MTYANVVFSYGAERFISACRAIEIDGLILPDLPFEEKDEFLPLCRKYGVDLISLIAPTSENRIAMIAKEAEGFLYIVSSLGVTGARSEIKTDISSIVNAIRKNTDIPCAVGFGISTPEQAKKMAAIADGVIVGSAIVKILEEYGKDAPPYIGAYVKSIERRCSDESVSFCYVHCSIISCVLNLSCISLLPLQCCLSLYFRDLRLTDLLSKEAERVRTTSFLLHPRLSLY